ncbi:bifunctional DNA primase/polymerase [Mangrovibrevibacter kandeliae]|uniref:hypothetical protein n=1 Tax=Mangrovibrevibacter kandeliae TaxID=2968473 RepID=UPI00211821FF|nr:hypothetical protein [Aurantimonas sp. CSK15Z-1]
MGIVGGAVAALDIDIAEDGKLALHIERLARERLGDTPALRIGKPPKRLLVYRATEPFAGIRRAPLEMLCLGQQFVASAEHPDTGQPYAWPDAAARSHRAGRQPRGRQHPTSCTAKRCPKPSGRTAPQRRQDEHGVSSRHPTAVGRVSRTPRLGPRRASSSRFSR